MYNYNSNYYFNNTLKMDILGLGKSFLKRL